MVDGPCLPGVRSECEGVQTSVPPDLVHHGYVHVHKVEVVAGERERGGQWIIFGARMSTISDVREKNFL